MSIILVTGAAGGLGRTVVQRALERGHNMRGYVRSVRKGVPLIAHGVERKHLLALPGPQLHLFTGIVYGLMDRSQFISNRIFQGIVGWKPLVASAHEGWAQLIQRRKQ